MTSLTEQHNDRVYRAMTEQQTQTQIIGIARFYDWTVYHTHDSRRSQPGWPDLVLLKAPRVLFVEVKTHRGRLRPEQRTWLADLAACGLEVTVWRPSDIDGTVVRALGPAAQRLTWNGAT